MKLKQEIKLDGKTSKAKSWRDNNEMRNNTSGMLMVKHSILSTVGIMLTETLICELFLALFLHLEKQASPQIV